MGKKKNKQIIRPWCWYCEREFEDEKVLMQHQKAKHFKCGMCPRRLNTAGGLAVHIQQVHKLEPDNLPKIENAIPGRDGYEVEIFGMEGIPAPDVADYKRRKEIELGLAAGSISQPQSKRPRIENRALTEEELRVALEQHRALMGGHADSTPAPASTDPSSAVYGAPPQAYSAGPTAGPIPAFPPPGGVPFLPPPGMPGLPPFGMPGFPPPPGFPPLPPGMMPPPGILPPPGIVPPGAPPPGMPLPPGFPHGMPPPGLLPPPSAMAPPPSFVPAQSSSNGAAPAPESVPLTPSAPPPSGPTLPNPALKQTNPPFKKETLLMFTDANFAPEELRAFHPKYYTKPGLSDVSAPSSSNVVAAGGDESRGKKRARAEDFLD